MRRYNKLSAAECGERKRLNRARKQRVMLVSYPTKYRDRFGEEAIIIENDGKMLRTRIRGIELAGDDFKNLQSRIDMNSSRPTNVPIYHVEVDSPNPYTWSVLHSCTLECEIPIPVVTSDGLVIGLLRAHIELANHDDENSDHLLRLELSLQGHSFESSGTAGWFESELEEIQFALPQDTYIKACMNCALSEYNPFQSGGFTDLACFKDKPREEAVGHKGKGYPGWAGYKEYVQDIYLCSQFELRELKRRWTREQSPQTGDAA